MTDEIKKMLELENESGMSFLTESRMKDGLILCNPKTQNELLKLLEYAYRMRKGFECLMEQRDFYRWKAGDDVEAHNKRIMQDNAELEAAMRGDK